MPPLTGYLFSLGLASGITVMTATAYRHFSPAWLKGVLVATAAVLLLRYVGFAFLVSPSVPQRFVALQYAWLATPMCLLVPSAVAADQLVRHPAMTPKRLLSLLSPVLIGYGLVMVLAHLALIRTGGWPSRLASVWSALFLILQLFVALGFTGVCLLLIRKIPVRPIRQGLLLLALSQILQGLNSIRLVGGIGSPVLSIHTEIASLLAIWFACETGARLQQTG